MKLDKPARFVSTQWDINAIKNYQQKIQELNKELEARVEARTAELKASNQDLENFAYSISHDLRAPLRHINGYSRLLNQRSDDILDGNTKEFVGFIADAALKLSQQIEDLLQYSRIGRKEIKVEEINVQKLINTQILTLQKENPARQLDFKIAVLPQISGDALLLEQLFYNLLSNAVKYSGREPLAIIEVGVEQQYITAILFSYEIMELGLILPIQTNCSRYSNAFTVKVNLKVQALDWQMYLRIVQRHHGKVWGESELEKGATFYVNASEKDKCVGREYERFISHIANITQSSNNELPQSISMYSL